MNEHRTVYVKCIQHKNGVFRQPGMCWRRIPARAWICSPGCVGNNPWSWCLWGQGGQSFPANNFQWFIGSTQTDEIFLSQSWLLRGHRWKSNQLHVSITRATFCFHQLLLFCVIRSFFYTCGKSDGRGYWLKEKASPSTLLSLCRTVCARLSPSVQSSSWAEGLY